MEITIDQAIDVGYATLWRIKKDALAMTFGTGHYELFNMWFGDKAERNSGDMIKDYITLKDTGNGKHISLWEEDTHNTVNTDKEIRVDWSHYTTNLSYNRVELGMNMSDEVRVYNYLKGKMDNMYRELAEDIQSSLVLSPTSASDKKNPHGLASWLSLGTDGSAGAWNAYSGIYNDGSATTYSVGGIASTSASLARWASYYADHEGSLGDALLTKLFRATTQTKFIVPIVPKAGKIDESTGFGNFRYYTNLNVVANLETLLRKSDDQIGSDLGKYAGVIVYKGIPMMYLEELDAAASADTALRGTDPIYGVNHDWFKLTVLKDNDFVIGKPTPRDNQHNVLKVHCDVSYAVHCTNRQRAGFLISQQ